MSSKISLIIKREYNQRVRKKSFIITTILTPLLFVGLMTVPALMMHYGGDEKLREIVVVDQSGMVGSKLENSDKVKFTPTDQTYEQAQISVPEAFGYLIVGENIIAQPDELKLYTRETSTIGLEKEITGQISSIIESERIAKTNIAGLDSIMRSVKARSSLATFTIVEQQPGSDTQGEHQGKSTSSILSMGLGYVGGFMIYMFIFIYGAFVMQGVIEEKSSRIIEVMVSSVKPFQLMMGKIVGIALVALTQLFVWIILFGVFAIAIQGVLMSGVEAQVGDVAAVAASQGIDPDVVSMFSMLSDPGYLLMVLGCYMLYFVGGYLLYAAMFAAVGSAVDNAQDASQLQLPITVPLILAILVMMNAMQTPNSAVAFWFSIIPFTSPIVMMARIPYGVPAWEIITSLVLLYGTFIGMTWVSAKIYRIGIFMYGKKPSLKELVKWARYKS